MFNLGHLQIYVMVVQVLFRETFTSQFQVRIWFQYVPVPSMVPSPSLTFWATSQVPLMRHKYQIPQVSTKKQNKTSSYQPPPMGGVFSPQNGVAKNGTPSTPIHLRHADLKVGSKGNFPTFNFPTHQPSTSQLTNLQLPNSPTFNFPSFNFPKLSGKDLEPVRLHPITSKWINSFKSPWSHWSSRAQPLEVVF